MTLTESHHGAGAGGEARIGVFVCHCGTNIGGIVDVPAVAEYASKLPKVVYAERNLYTCAEDGIASIRAHIKEHDLNRVIVASCTPRTHSPLFMSACASAGLNPYLFEFVNIRDQCSWIHMQEKAKATEKAKDLVRMGVAKAALLEPLERIETPMEPVALVIGGGVAGLTAAKTIANSGHEVWLVERAPVLGGMVRQLHHLHHPGSDPSIIKPLVDEVESHERIHVLKATRVADVKGYVGNFEVTVAAVDGGARSSFKVGAVVVATGAMELKPRGLYGYGELPNVMTELELEALMNEGRLRDVGTATFIMCAGSRGQLDLTYCSRVCCMTTLKNAIAVKRQFPKASVMVHYRDVESYGIAYEELNAAARKAGVRFIRYSLKNPPRVTSEKGGGASLRVSYRDELMGRDAETRSDIVVLSTPMVQHEDGKDMAMMLRVPLGPDRFFFEAHVKLRPIDFATDGVFLAGTAHGPKDIEESVGQGLGAAARVLTLIRHSKVMSEPIIAHVDADRCTGCGTCLKVCAYAAITRGEDRKAAVTSSLCKGCGTCVATCPERAIDEYGFSEKQLYVQANALLQAGGEA